MGHPIFFRPIPMERIWGGRELEIQLRKNLPPAVRVGEMWEIVDREDTQSIVIDGKFTGASLNDLWKNHREEVFGVHYSASTSEHFPLLLKILDAREKLSVQVHPPASIAKSMQGEPKTEVWYFLQCRPDADIYAGLKRGSTRADLEKCFQVSGVETLLHNIPVRSGQSIFIPSGRVHAIGGGNLIIEIQQNSDTTYRVFDWNRIGLDGQSRELHIKESLASINFQDFEPSIQESNQLLIADCPYFKVEKVLLTSKQDIRPSGRFALVVSVKNAVCCAGMTFGIGSFFLVPANGVGLEISPLLDDCEILVCTLP